MRHSHFFLAAALLLLTTTAAFAQTTPSKPSAKTAAAAQQPTLYVVGYTHLDTQWCWTYPQVIGEFLPNTLHDNFRLFDKYPDYVFNWTGANRYKLMKEYYPADYKTLKRYVAQGRWYPNGSSLEEGDVDVPSEESIIRQVLYGNDFFRQEFGKAGSDFMLPDCFGFPASLPSILAHCGIKGFSTQKLNWGSAVGIPFNVGVWKGPDGQGVVAALNPGDYNSHIENDQSKDQGWLDRIKNDAKNGAPPVDYRYYGTGDRGGAPAESSVQMLETSLHDPGPLHVVSARADQMFNDLIPAQIAKLPRYQGDLLLTHHSAGSITSEAEMKRWNHENEKLGGDAERVSLAADWLGALPYDHARITDAWWRFLPGQFHDIMAGTALPKAYEYAWNDQVIAMNEFSDVLREAAGGVARALDTRAKGIPVIVNNPLSSMRQDTVTATLSYAGKPLPNVVRVVGGDGREVSSQVIGSDAQARTLTVLFLARVPSLGFAVYDVRPARAEAAVASNGALKVTANSLENARYKVRLDANGDIASIFDKRAGREMLSAPARLAFMHEKPMEYPAWNMDWEDQQKPPYAYLDGPATIRIAESGPVRVALQVSRSAQGSHFVQTIRLSNGDSGDRIEFATHVVWKTKASVLKAVFPLSVSNQNATYNWELGTVRRGTDKPVKYEVPSHQWFDLTDTSGRYGVSVLDQDRYGSDKPDDKTLRLTLLYTPGVRDVYQHQASQDWGEHDLLYAISGHAGGWQSGGTQWQAMSLDHPLIAFQSQSHPGMLGSSFSVARTSTPQVSIEALKKAEHSDEMIVRFNELAGRSARGVACAFAGKIVSAREVDGQERPIGPATIRDGKLVFDMSAYRPRAFAVRLAPPAARLAPPMSAPLSLASQIFFAGSNNALVNNQFDKQDDSIPAQMLPATLTSGGIQFKLRAAPNRQQNSYACRGQSLALPAGTHRRLYLLASSVGGDTPATFTIGNTHQNRAIQSWDGYIGQWDNRQWQGEVPKLTYRWNNPLAGLVPGYIKRAPLAWYADHKRKSDGTNDIYSFCYIYRYAFDVPDSARVITLPNDPAIRIFAATVARNANDDTTPAQPLYDELLHTAASIPNVSPEITVAQQPGPKS